MPARKSKRISWITEHLTAILLLCKGYRVHGLNVTIAGVEVDILAEKAKTLVVVEVKHRQHILVGHGAIKPNQKKRLEKVAAYLSAKKDRAVRCDLVVWCPTRPFVQHLSNIWDAQG